MILNSMANGLFFVFFQFTLLTFHFDFFYPGSMDNMTLFFFYFFGKILFISLELFKKNIKACIFLLSLKNKNDIQLVMDSN